MVIQAAQTIVSRKINPLDQAILSFCTIHGGRASNVIPEDVILTGSIRTLDPEKREALANELDQVARGIARTSGGGHRLELNMQYPSVFNHPKLTEEFKKEVLDWWKKTGGKSLKL